MVCENFNKLEHILEEILFYFLICKKYIKTIEKVNILQYSLTQN